MHAIIPKYQISLRLPIYGKTYSEHIFATCHTILNGGGSIDVATLIMFIIFQRMKNSSFNQSFQSGRKVQTKDRLRSN